MAFKINLSISILLWFPAFLLCDMVSLSLPLSSLTEAEKEEERNSSSLSFLCDWTTRTLARSLCSLCFLVLLEFVFHCALVVVIILSGQKDLIFQFLFTSPAPPLSVFSLMQIVSKENKKGEIFFKFFKKKKKNPLIIFSAPLY